MTKERILVVDDEESICHVLSVILGKENFLVETSTTAVRAIELTSRNTFDLVLCDIRMPDMDGIELLKQLKKQDADLTIIMMTAFGTLENAVDAMREGAYDYLSKPIKAKEIILHINKALERRRLMRENTSLRDLVEERFGFHNIIGKSRTITKIFDTIKKIAPYDSSVLITGESGTGKELIAKAIHYNSRRRHHAFLAINCGAIPADLLESELFGHLRGSFSGAHSTKRGLFEEADGGTLFLDEIADIPEASQVKLLRALQEEEIRPVGSNLTIKVDVRIIAATEQNLEQRIRQGIFRESLFYRLNVVHIELPPLREREEDVPLLAEFFINQWCRKNNRNTISLKPEALDILMNHSWPGNVRELENVIERSLLMAGGADILPEHLPKKLVRRHGDIDVSIPDDSYDLKVIQKHANALIEQELITRALMKTNNNRTHAAKLLKISPRALHYKMKEYGIDCHHDEP